MTGNDALLQLQCLVHGRADAGSARAWDEFVRLGLAVSAEPAGLKQAAELADLADRYRARTAEELKKTLAELEEDLRSDFHRMTSFRSTLEREERDRARIRRALASFDHARDHEETRNAVAAREQAAPDAQFFGCPGRSTLWAISSRGLRATGALQARIDRYGAAPFQEFLARFAKADEAMARFTRDRQRLDAALPYVPKGRTFVIDGLLKSGLALPRMVEAYQKALDDTNRSYFLVERPHVAVALVRGEKAATDFGPAAAAYDRAYERLVAAGGFARGPVLRGAVKSVVRMPDTDAAIARFIDLYRGLASLRVTGDEAVRIAARLLPAHGTAGEVVTRFREAQGRIQAEMRSQVPYPAAAAAAIVSGARDTAHMNELIHRFRAILDELARQHAFSGSAPACTADLPFCPGTPAEIVDLLHAFVAILASRAPGPRWGSAEEFETACAFARRFAY